MKKIELEYLFPYSIKFLLKRFATASGLSEWFAEDVAVDGDIFTFMWKNYSLKAKKISNNQDYVKFIWLENPQTYTEFKFERNKLSKNTSIFITDYVEDEEDENETKTYWDNLIKNLKWKLGVS